MKLSFEFLNPEKKEKTTKTAEKTFNDFPAKIWTTSGLHLSAFSAVLAKLEAFLLSIGFLKQKKALAILFQSAIYVQNLQFQAVKSP